MVEHVIRKTTHLGHSIPLATFLEPPKKVNTNLPEMWCLYGAMPGM